MTSSIRAAVFGVAAMFALPLAAPAQDSAAVPDVPNDICGPEVDSYRFSVSEIGPKLAGTWSAQAPGIGMTQGVQTFTVEISYKNGRLYMSGGGGGMTELVPVRGARKALRYDFIHQKPLPPEAHAVEVSLDDFALVFNCDLAVAPQFTWAMGTGARRASGVYTFVSPNHAIGTMANSAAGAREVYLSR
jgi:hypothetical protein